MKKFIWIIFAIIYVVFPFDIIPDVLLGLGQSDDLLVVAYSIWRFFKEESSRRKSQEGDGKSDERTTREPEANAAIKTPHETLGLEKHASGKEIERAYKTLMAQYHPDKVNHLGPELKELAHKKSLEIQQAYEKLT